MRKARTARETRVTRKDKGKHQDAAATFFKDGAEKDQAPRRSALFVTSRDILPGIAPMPPRDLEREAWQSQRGQRRFLWSLSCVPPCIM